MNFNEHSELEGLHAFLGGSNYHWINYDEEKLYNSYSNYLAATEYCFGCADAISFKHNFLRIHDLKTGKGPTHMEQLEIYASLFCLEYDVDVSDIEIELRIYQNNEVRIHKPEITDIVPIMDKIVTSDRLIKEWENGYYE